MSGSGSRFDPMLNQTLQRMRRARNTRHGNRVADTIAPGMLQGQEPYELGSNPDTYVQAIGAASDTISIPPAYGKSLSNAGSITMTSTPTITLPTTHRFLLLGIGSASGDITLQDEGTLSGSGLELGAGTRNLLSDQWILLFSMKFTATWKWIEVGFTG